MNEKILLLDIDGTLTEPGYNNPPDSALEAIRKAQANGHKVFLCTGRNLAMLRPLLKYNFDGYVASAGGYVVCDGEVVFDRPMKPEVFRLAMDVFGRNHVFRTVECLDGTYGDNGLEDLLEGADAFSNSELLRFRRQLSESLDIRPMSEYNGAPVYKIVFMCTDRKQLDEPMEVLKEHFVFCVQNLEAVEWDGKTAIIDGYNSCIYIEPEEELLRTLDEKRVRDLEQRAMLQQLKGQPNVTLDGREINVYANIGNVSDVGMVLDNDAGGIGLFRSEFIYLNSKTFPTEDEQFAIYKKVAEMMGGKKVIIRTLDIGADKQADYFNLPKEENPALGYRAIRICLMQHEIFKAQIRAILRAAAYGKVSIMFPMIISVSEVKEAKAILEECRKELLAEGKEVGEVEIGIMIETPAAVMVADELAEEVEFFSIGTNDLTQYTLAIDRQNPKLDHFYDSHHPAVLRLIDMTVQAGHRHNCWVGICGELGADTTLTETFLRMGLDELSVNPGGILGLRKVIRELDLGGAQEPETEAPAEEKPAAPAEAPAEENPAAPVKSPEPEPEKQAKKGRFSLFGKNKNK